MRTHFRRYSSSLGRARFQIVLIPKYRHKIFGYDKIKRFCEVLFVEISNTHNFRILEMGFDVDHVHMMVDIGINLKIHQLIKLLKGITSRRLFQTFPWLRTSYFWSGHIWSPAYYFDSVGDATYDVTSRYVKKQGRKGDMQRRLNHFIIPGSC